MIFTIGGRESYRKAKEEGKGTVFKLGRSIDYTGGIVFQCRGDAQDHIDEFYSTKVFSVFAIEADWNKDTYLGEGDTGVSHRHLKSDAKLRFEPIAICGKCRDGSAFVTKVGEVYRVRCGNPDCGAAGGSSPDPEGAKRLWNRRDELDRVYELAELRMDRAGCAVLKEIITEVLSGKDEGDHDKRYSEESTVQG